MHISITKFIYPSMG